jgi:lipase chaperone LimK
VLRDETLSAEERQRRLDDLDQRLPESARQARGEALAALRLTEDEEQLRAAGGSPDDVRALREQRFGPQAAERLAALDEERAAWQQRVDDYRRARRAIAGDVSLGDAERARALGALLEERFSPQERLRVEALDQIGD